MNMVSTKLGKTFFLLGMAATLLGCESKEEKQVRIEADTAAEQARELEQLFAGKKRLSVDLGQQALEVLRQGAPQQSILFEGETAEMTAAGDGAVSACSPTLGVPQRLQYCLGKPVVAHGMVTAVDDSAIYLDILGVGLGVRLPEGSTPPSLNDEVLVRGIATAESGNDHIVLAEASIEKQARVADPAQVRVLDALRLGNACMVGRVELKAISQHVADVAMDADDREGGVATVSDGGRKIDGAWRPYLKRCVFRAGKLVGEQVREGTIADGKVVLAKADAHWESDKVLTARLDKADAARRAEERKNNPDGRPAVDKNSLEYRRRDSALTACTGLTSNYSDAVQCMKNMGY